MSLKPLDLKNQTLVTVKADVCDGDGVALVTLEPTDYKLLVAQLTILYDIYSQRYDLEKLTKKDIDEHFYDNFTAYLKQYVELPAEDILFTAMTHSQVSFQPHLLMVFGQQEFTKSLWHMTIL